MVNPLSGQCPRQLPLPASISPGRVEDVCLSHASTLLYAHSVQGTWAGVSDAAMKANLAEKRTNGPCARRKSDFCVLGRVSTEAL